MAYSAASAGCNMIVAELGGDYLSAGASDLLADSWVREWTALLVAICPDLPSVAGVLALTHEPWRAKLRFGPTKAHNVLLADRMRKLCGVGIEPVSALVEAALLHQRLRSRYSTPILPAEE
jgi:hypothetical protein